MTGSRTTTAVLVCALMVFTPMAHALGGPDHEHHDGCQPTRAEVERAAEFARRTAEQTRRYADVRVALAAGYRPFLAATIVLPVVHYSKQAHYEDGYAAHPSRPETLMYANTYSGPKLIGVMYLMEPDDAEPPDLGGCIVQWHRHVICRYADGRKAPSPNGDWCPPGTERAESAAMLHVWTEPMEDGPYQRHPDRRWQCWPRPSSFCGG